MPMIQKIVYKKFCNINNKISQNIDNRIYNDDAKIVISKDATLPRVEAYKSLNINTKKNCY